MSEIPATSPPRQLLPEGTSSAWWKSNLAFALLRLPSDIRQDMMIFYQFCRVLDDLADETSIPLNFRTAGLEQWKQALEGKLPLPRDLERVLTKHNVPRSLLIEIHSGVSRDLEPVVFPDWTSLQSYCEQVAVAVGLASNHITGCTTPASTEYAHNLGMALQLTNILRDVREDSAMGRVYFTMEDMAACGVSREEILHGRPGRNFPKLWLLQAARAEKFFTSVAAGAPPADRKPLAAAEIMRKLYARLLAKMQADGARVWDKRYRLSWMEKVSILVSCSIR